MLTSRKFLEVLLSNRNLFIECLDQEIINKLLRNPNFLTEYSEYFPEIDISKYYSQHLINPSVSPEYFKKYISLVKEKWNLREISLYGNKKFLLEYSDLIKKEKCLSPIKFTFQELKILTNKNLIDWRNINIGNFKFINRKNYILFINFIVNNAINLHPYQSFPEKIYLSDYELFNLLRAFPCIIKENKISRFWADTIFDNFSFKFLIENHNKFKFKFHDKVIVYPICKFVAYLDLVVKNKLIEHPKFYHSKMSKDNLPKLYYPFCCDATFEDLQNSSEGSIIYAIYINKILTNEQILTLINTRVVFEKEVAKILFMQRKSIQDTKNLDVNYLYLNISGIELERWYPNVIENQYYSPEDLFDKSELLIFLGNVYSFSYEYQIKKKFFNKIKSKRRYKPEVKFNLWMICHELKLRTIDTVSGTIKKNRTRILI